MLISACKPDDDGDIAVYLLECLKKPHCHIIAAGDSTENINQDHFYFSSCNKSFIASITLTGLELPPMSRKLAG